MYCDDLPRDRRNSVGGLQKLPNSAIKARLESGRAGNCQAQSFVSLRPGVAVPSRAQR